ncbi:Retrovirus-related Pol polyprotein from transposon 412 [Frankliniella fusca]|uniref:RNA-directed DNA polymerase n=1 Tax=Frankliniella fusca TaxID=407009 RepID=A0AAE1I1Q3_9NEOP|nr:Retrovirus-related Pol polyprotein from transposon 412 [Frankliniella fusca]
MMPAPGSTLRTEREPRPPRSCENERESDDDLLSLTSAAELERRSHRSNRSRRAPSNRSSATFVTAADSERTPTMVTADQSRRSEKTAGPGRRGPARTPPQVSVQTLAFMIKGVPKFSGEPGESVNAYLDAIERTANEFSGEFACGGPVMLRMLKMTIRGVASEAFGTAVTTWEQAKEMLRRRFGNTETEVEANFRALTQKKDEAVSDFAKRVRSAGDRVIATRPGYKEGGAAREGMLALWQDTLAAVFKAGLSPQLQQRVSTAIDNLPRKATFEDIIHLACNYEVSTRQAPSKGLLIHAVAAQAPAAGKPAAAQPAPAPALQPAAPVLQVSGQQQGGGQRGNYRGAGARCYGCGNVGHIRKSCPYGQGSAPAGAGGPNGPVKEPTAAAFTREPAANGNDNSEKNTYVSYFVTASVGEEPAAEFYLDNGSVATLIRESAVPAGAEIIPAPAGVKLQDLSHRTLRVAHVTHLPLRFGTKEGLILDTPPHLFWIVPDYILPKHAGLLGSDIIAQNDWVIRLGVSEMYVKGCTVQLQKMEVKFAWRTELLKEAGERAEGADVLRFQPGPPTPRPRLSLKRDSTNAAGEEGSGQQDADAVRRTQPETGSPAAAGQQERGAGHQHDGVHAQPAKQSRPEVGQSDAQERSQSSGAEPVRVAPFPSQRSESSQGARAEPPPAPPEPTSSEEGDDDLREDSEEEPASSETGSFTTALSGSELQSERPQGDVRLCLPRKIKLAPGAKVTVAAGDQLLPYQSLSQYTPVLGERGVQVSFVEDHTGMNGQAALQLENFGEETTALVYLPNYKKFEQVRVFRWSLYLSSFDYTIVYKAGRLNTVADALSRALPEPEHGGESSSEPSFEKDILKVAALQVEKDGEYEPVYDEGRFKEEQRRDVTYGPIIAGLEDGQEHANFFLADGLLHRRVGSDGLHAVVVPPTMTDKLVRDFHCPPWAAHASRDRTLSKLRERFWWPGMYTQVLRFTRGCHSCALYKRGTHARPAPLQLPVVPRQPFEAMATDLYGPLPVSSYSGARYVLLAICLHTRWVEAIPLRDQMAPTVARAIVQEIVCRYGCPEYLVSDNGACYSAKLYTEMCRILQVRAIKTTPLHAMSNGVVERANQVMGQALCHYVNEKKHDWEEFLQLVMCSVRSSVSRSTGETPYFSVFHRDMSLPTAALLTPRRVTYADTPALTEKLLQDMSLSTELLRQENIKAKQEGKQYYDRRAGEDVKFYVGQRVYLAVKVKKKGLGRKWRRRYSGPWRIVERLSPTTFKIRTIFEQKPQVYTVHCNRLKHAYEYDNLLTAERRRRRTQDLAEDTDGPDLEALSTSSGSESDVTEPETESRTRRRPAARRGTPGAVVASRGASPAAQQGHTDGDEWTDVEGDPERGEESSREVTTPAAHATPSTLEHGGLPTPVRQGATPAPRRAPARAAPPAPAPGGLPTPARQGATPAPRKASARAAPPAPAPGGLPTPARQGATPAPRRAPARAAPTATPAQPGGRRSPSRPQRAAVTRLPYLLRRRQGAYWLRARK